MERDACLLEPTDNPEEVCLPATREAILHIHHKHVEGVAVCLAHQPLEAITGLWVGRTLRDDQCVCLIDDGTELVHFLAAQALLGAQ